jgi:hypothetical protein
MKMRRAEWRRCIREKPEKEEKEHGAGDCKSPDGNARAEMIAKMPLVFKR